MNLLLDTHALIWALENNPTLDDRARTAIIDGHNLVFVSAATAWEISIKRALGKLEAPDNLLEEIEAHIVAAPARTAAMAYAKLLAVFPDIAVDLAAPANAGLRAEIDAAIGEEV